MSIEMDIHLKLEFPSISSGINLVALVDYLLTANPEFHYFAQTEVTFRFNCDISFLHFVAFSWIPAISYVRKNNTGPEHHTLNLEPNTQSSLYQNECNTQILPKWVQDSCLSIGKGDTKLCESGVGGTYFVYDSEITKGNEPVSVFKPTDEEPGAPNNPKQSSPSFVPMMAWGTGAHREVAAFKLDKGFVGVPETHFVEVPNDYGTKKGSLQKFVTNDGDCSDVGANKFSVEDVHRIGIFDIRILNMDRNDENLLVLKSSEKEWKLIPIDHTYAFPNSINSYFNWQFWNQTKKPFSASNLAYIEQINPIEDALMLLETGINEQSVRNVTGSTLLLQKAAIKGFNLFSIASMVSGMDNDLVRILLKVKEKESMIENKDHGVVDRLNIFKTIAEEIIEDVLRNK
jgi:hypothetical protein